MYIYIKEYYLMGLYTDEDLTTFVKAGMITEEQKQEILKSKLGA